MGWVEDKGGIKDAKAGKKEGPKKALGSCNVTGGPIKKAQDTQGLNKGSWTGFPHEPKESMEVEAQVTEVGLKRKSERSKGSKEGRAESYKKQKVEEETKKLSLLFATHLRAVEVAEQPRQTQ